MGEPAAERKTAAVPPAYAHSWTPGGQGGLQDISAHLRAGYRFMYRTDIRIITGISVRLAEKACGSVYSGTASETGDASIH